MTERQATLTETGRIEAFSDGVFAIALTLLVLDLPKPSGPLLLALRETWPSDVAYLVAFFTIASIWVNHHSAFARIRRADPAVIVANLLILLGTSLVPWPTSLISTALTSNAPTSIGRGNEAVAIAAYAGITAFVGAGWVVLTSTLVRRQTLLGSSDDVGWMRWMRRNAALSIGVEIIAAALGFAEPVLALVALLCVPVAFFVVFWRSKA